MATRNADLRVTIDADAAKLERAIASANRSMMRFESQLRSTDLQAAQLDQIINEQRAQATKRVGQAMVGFGVAVAAGLGLAVKAAIDWESAWTGVLKTVEGTPQQLAKVEKGLRDLATTLPSSHREIAAVAEAAGQLGIATDDVVAFTRVMIDLGETTNLTAEEAATAIAQMMNVMQTAPEDVGRLGAALVELGNNGASTERDIIEMAQRISGAGAIINLSEADVLALSNALASVGINAEAGGTAISTAMIKMADAVASGGESVTEFADVAGMSAQEFTQAFETDPARAIQAFVEGLARIDASGGNVFATLKDLELGNIRTRDSLLRLAGAGDLLGQSLDDGARAWEENTALIDEAAKRYDTAEAKIQIAKNAVVDFAIDMGSVLLPVIASLAEGVASVAQFLGDLPGPVQTVATAFAVLLGAAALLGGGFLLLAPKILAAQTVMLTLARTAPVMYGAMAYTGQFLGLLGGLAAVAAAFAFLKSTAGDTDIGIGRATEALIDMRRGVSNDLIDNLDELQSKLNDADRVLGIIPTSLGGFTMSGKEAAEITNEYKATVEALDQALAHLVTSGDTEAAADAAKRLNDEFGIGTDQLPTYVDALAAAEAEHKAVADSVDPVQDALAELATQFGLTGEDAAKAAQEMLDSWSDAAADFFSFTDAYDTALAAKEEAERETATATAEATEDATDSWEDFVADVTLSVDDYLLELDRQVKAQEEWELNLLTIAGRVPGAMFNELVAMGPAGADAVALMAEMTDEELGTAVDAWTRTTGEGADAIADRLAEAGPVLAQIAASHGQEVANKVRDHMIKNGVGVFEAAKALDVKIEQGLKPGKSRNIPINLTGKQQALEGINDIKRAIDRLPSGKKITITATGDIRVGGGTALRAMGGPVEAGEPYIVGERGPELFVPRRGGEIVPNHKLAMGGPVSKIDIRAREDINATDWNDMVSGVARQVGNAAGAVPGKVLPTGSYRIGRGPAGHGYNARDLPAPIGTPVYAAASGIVSRAARLATSYGIHAAISHAGWRSLYAHMSQMYVRTGQQISRGQIIGRVGSTGNSTGPHLHLEPDNPQLYDWGGKWRHGELGLNTSGGTEYVLSPQQSRTFDRFVSVMERARGGDGAQAIDQFALARTVGDAVGRSINGATLIMDDRGRGRLIARESDLYGRAG